MALYDMALYDMTLYDMARFASLCRYHPHLAGFMLQVDHIEQQEKKCDSEEFRLAWSCQHAVLPKPKPCVNLVTSIRRFV